MERWRVGRVVRKNQAEAGVQFFLLCFSLLPSSERQKAKTLENKQCLAWFFPITLSTNLPCPSTNVNLLLRLVDR